MAIQRESEVSILPTVISAEMAHSIGSVLDRRVSYPVSALDILRFALCAYYPYEPPCFGDPVVGDMEAPEEFDPFAWVVREGRPRGGNSKYDGNTIEELIGINGPNLSRVVDGGVSLTYGAKIRPNDVITSVRVLLDYSEKVGRSGNLLLITTTEDTWTNQRGQFVKSQRDYVIRFDPI